MLGLILSVSCAGGEPGADRSPSLGSNGEGESSGSTAGDESSTSNATGTAGVATGEPDASSSSSGGAAVATGGSGSEATGSATSTSGSDCEQVSATLAVDWAEDCTGADGSVSTPNLPPGKYRATALSGGGTETAPPWDVPEEGWTYKIQCTDLELDDIRADGLYASAEEAFANINVTTQDFDWPGGVLTCANHDTNCANNDGVVRFQVDLLCE